MSTIQEDGLSYQDYLSLREGSHVLKSHARFFTKRFLKNISRGRILEVGCGAGFLLLYLRQIFQHNFTPLKKTTDKVGGKVKEVDDDILNPISAKTSLTGFSYIGTDIDYHILDLSKQVEGIEGIFFVQNSDTALPFKDGSFDRIICDGTFHHFDEPERMFSEMYRVLSLGGEMVILNIDAGFIFARVFKFYYRLKSFLHLASKTDFALYNTIMQSPSLKEMESFLERLNLGIYSIFRKRTFFLARVKKKIKPLRTQRSKAAI